MPSDMGPTPDLQLNLVYNPNGPHLPPPEATLTDAYRQHLSTNFGIVFNQLWTITNMPIQRWREDLDRRGQLHDYMRLLVDNYNPATLDSLMCRHQIHIDSQGNLFDCDFNYALELGTPGLESRKLWEVTLEQLESRRIATADHCYGCTAGCGSSCGGTLSLTIDDEVPGWGPSERRVERDRDRMRRPCRGQCQRPKARPTS